MPRGSFGRRRRQASNLTSLIMQLVAQQRAAEDRAIFDAYENGGLYRGKPVDDARLRSYIKSRRDSMGKSGNDDPLWDEWNNRLQQLDFKIGEEKVTLAFREGRVGAGAVASYYRSQLSKLTKDSAFYRDVAGRAAQWAQSASSAARGRARGRANAALNSAFEANVKRQSDFLTLDAYVTEYAKRAGIIAGNETITDADATDIQALFAQNLPGPNGGTITMRDYQDASLDYYKALGQDIQLSAQAGRGVKTKTTARAKFLNQHLIRLNTVDDRSKYELAREAMDEAWNNATDPYAQRDAVNEYIANLTGIRDAALASDGYRRNDPEFIGGLNNEINAITTGQPSGPTVADLQSSSGEGTPTADMQEKVDAITNLRSVLDRLDSGAAVLGQSEPGGPLDVIDLGPSAAMDPFGRNGFDDSMQPAIQNIDGRKQVVWLKGEPVRANLVLDRNGQSVDPSLTPDMAEGLRNGKYTLAFDNGEAPVRGFVFTMTDGTQQFGVLDRTTGRMLFTEHSPFGPGLYTDANGLTALGIEVNRTWGQGGFQYEVGFGKPLSIADGSASPFLSDSTVAPGDLLALAESGDPRFGRPNPAQLDEYKARVRAQDHADRIARGERDMGLQDRLGIGQQDAMTRGGGGDLRQGVLDAISAASKLAEQAFNAPRLNVTPTPNLPGFGSAPGIVPPVVTPAVPSLAPPKPTQPTNPQIADIIGGGGSSVGGPGGSDSVDDYLQGQFGSGGGSSTAKPKKPAKPKPTTNHQHL